MKKGYLITTDKIDGITLFDPYGVVDDEIIDECKIIYDFGRKYLIIGDGRKEVIISDLPKFGDVWCEPDAYIWHDLKEFKQWIDEHHSKGIKE